MNVRVELMTLSSAVGGLQRCERTNLYTPEKGFVEDSFYRLAGIMRDYLKRPEADPDRLMAGLAYAEYKETLDKGIYSEYQFVEGKLKSQDTLIKDADVCKKMEAKLKAAQKPGNLLDRKPVDPINPGQPT